MTPANASLRIASTSTCFSRAAGDPRRHRGLDLRGVHQRTHRVHVALGVVQGALPPVRKGRRRGQQRREHQTEDRRDASSAGGAGSRGSGGRGCGRCFSHRALLVSGPHLSAAQVRAGRALRFLMLVGPLNRALAPSSGLHPERVSASRSGTVASPRVGAPHRRRRGWRALRAPVDGAGSPAPDEADLRGRGLPSETPRPRRGSITTDDVEQMGPVDYLVTEFPLDAEARQDSQPAESTSGA